MYFLFRRLGFLLRNKLHMLKTVWKSDAIYSDWSGWNAISYCLWQFIQRGLDINVYFADMNVLVRVIHFTDVSMLRPVEMEFILCHFSFHHMVMETVKQAATELQDLHL